MPLTSRKKRQLEREPGVLRDARLIVIATEGEITEKKYFGSGHFEQRRIRIKVLETKDGLSDPEHVYDRLKDYEKEYDLSEDDQLWAVIDKDHHPDHKLAQIFSEVSRIKQVRSELVISNPCFEIWFLLHFPNLKGLDKLKNCSDVEAELRKILGAYNKNNPPIDRLIPETKTAIANAKNLDNGKRIPAAKSTQVHKLVSELLKLGNQ